ncbi:MAG: hypothetical protein ACLVK8_02400 [Ruminococcus sp.]
MNQVQPPPRTWTRWNLLVRGVSRRTDAYEYTDNRRNDEIEDPPPFDVNAPVIRLADRLAGVPTLWKTRRSMTARRLFRGIVAVDPTFPPVPGGQTQMTAVWRISLYSCVVAEGKRQICSRHAVGG